MKTMSATIMILSAMACVPLFALQCAWCNQPMQEDYLCCRNCGKEKGTHPPEAKHQEPVYMPAYVSPEKNTPVVQDYGTYRGYSYRDDAFSGFGGHLAGMGRGLATTSLAPLNFVRGMGSGCAWIDSVNMSNAGGEAVLYGGILFISVGAVMGTFATCADVINGVLDTVSVGFYGNWLYDSAESGRPTPWIWERKWLDNGIPWINR